jgi:predicted ATPase
MIRKARFENFKALRDVEITFDSRLTVLVGPNGSGKTSILEGIDRVSQFASGRQKETIFSGGDKLDDFATRTHAAGEGSEARPDITLEAEFTEAGTEWQFQVLARHTELSSRLDGPAPGPDDDWRCETRHRKAGEVAWAAHADKSQIPPPVRRLGSAVLLHLDAERMSAPSYAEESPPRLRPDGSMLPSVMAYLALNQPERFRELVKAITTILPAVRGVRFDRVPLYRAGGHTIRINDAEYTRETHQRLMGEVLLFDFTHAERVQGTMVSEGTLMVTGLLTAALSPTRPRLLLLDDLDKGLHPKAQMDLASLLGRLLQEAPDLQIIATSHSPYILDRLKPNEVRVTACRDDGSVACARLEAHPKYPVWRDSMSPGEFWSHAGEDWVKQVAPVTTAP